MSARQSKCVEQRWRNGCAAFMRGVWLPPSVRLALLAVTVMAAVAFGFAVPSVHSAEGSSQALTVAVHVSSDADGCYIPGLVHAIQQMMGAEAEAINARGGVAGRPIRLRFFDDKTTAEKTVRNVTTAIEDPRLLAMVGVSSSTRGLAVFAKIGDRIAQSGVPFITEVSLNSMFAHHPNVFTMAGAVDNELELLKTFFAAEGYKRLGFVGLEDDLYTAALGNGLKTLPAGLSLVADRRLPVENFHLTEDQIASVVKDLKATSPDVLVLGLGSAVGGQLIEALDKAGVSMPAFIVYGRISRLLRRSEPLDGKRVFYQFARDGVPNAYNERLRQRIWATPGRNWIFEDAPAPIGAAQWARLGCKTRKDAPLTLMADRNRRAIGRGAQYRDMLALLAQAGADIPAGTDLSEIRRHIVTHLRGFKQHERVMQGWWQDWSFTPYRTSAADTLVISRPAGAKALVLAPRQFVRVGGNLEPRAVVYLSLDLISITRIDTNDRSFDAEFYLSFRSSRSDLDIRSIEFTNAYRAQSGNDKLLSWHQIHAGDAQTNFPKDVKLYRVSGKFTFEPELSRFPFDTQRLSISFQPSSTARPFLIQPPADNSQDHRFVIDGWHTQEAYVGSDQDIIPTIGHEVGEKRIVPFYKFNYTWVVSRNATDYYLRVIVPLAFILLVTYFSVYLSHIRFEPMMGIQVTALLSAIALFLALPKVDSDQATLSDKVFMVTYAMVSAMVGLSVLKDMRAIHRRRPLRALVSGVQLIGFPVAAIGLFGYLVMRDQSLAATLSRLWGLSGDAVTMLRTWIAGA